MREFSAANPQNPPPIRLSGTISKSPYQLTLQSPDTDELYEYAPKLEAKLKAEEAFEVYRKRQDAEYLSDFDREIKRIEGKKP